MKKDGMVDYRQFRFNKLDTDEFRHLKLLIFWPIFGLLFSYVELVGFHSAYYPMHCSLDDYIPLCEYFLIPYLFWFVFLIGIHVYTLLFDTESFKKLIKYIMITYSSAMLTFLIFPTCQELRPLAFERDNIFTRLLTMVYQFDTNTNVCPSIHVIGSFAVLFAGWHSKHFHFRGWRIAFTITTVLISLSTVFLKQHSILDVFAALPICFIAYLIIYKKPVQVQSVQAASPLQSK